MLEIANLTVKYPQSSKAAVSNVTLSLPSGEIGLLLGGNHSGKSTVLACVSGLIPTMQKAEVEGRCSLMEQVGMAIQNSDVFLLPTVESELEFPLLNQGWPTSERRRRINELAEVFLLKPLIERNMHTLSGGEKQRVSLAAAVSAKPSVLLLDEPLSQLDEGFTDFFLKQIKQWAAKGLTVLIATTSSYQYRGLDPLCFWLREGRLCWQGRIDDFYSIQEKARADGIDVDGKGLFCKNNTIHFFVERPHILSLEGVTFRYEKRKILDNINVTVHPGEIVSITGPNGAGKSTLLKIAAGIIKPQNGNIFIQGKSIKGQKIAEANNSTGVLFQNPDHQISQDSVYKEVALGLKMRKVQKGIVKTRVDKWLNSLGMAHMANKHPYSLTKTERQWVALASVLVQEPALLLLDEPTHGFDALAAVQFMEVIVSLAAQGTAVLMVTHHRELACHYSHKVIKL